MSDITLSLNVRRMFFDRPEVQRQLGRRILRFLSLAGRDVRQQARKLLGPPSRRPPRPPGNPPRTRTSDERATLRNILYAMSGSRSAPSVIVGPVRLNQVNLSAINPGSIPVPQLHEFGGTVDIREESLDGGKTWWRRDMRFRPRSWKQYRTRRARYPARPFMRPALERAMQRWRSRGRLPGLSVGPGAASIGPAAA